MRGVYTSNIHTMYFLACFLDFSANLALTAALTGTGEALGEEIGVRYEAEMQG